MNKTRANIKKLSDYELIQVEKSLNLGTPNKIINSLNNNQNCLYNSKKKKLLDMVHQEMFNRWKKILGYK